MQARLFTLSGRETKIDFRFDNIGSGKSGAKSESYRKFQPSIEGAFHDLPLISVTPSFFDNFLKRAGVSHEKPQESSEAIARTDFERGEIDGLRSALAPFSELAVAIRSDESTAAGVGLWHTDFMEAGISAESARAMINIVKKILASDFSKSVIAFKKRVGLVMDETPGIFFMPLAGNNFSDLGYAITTPYHLNVILNFRGDDHLVNVGIGLGGANNFGATTTLFTGIYEMHFSLDRLVVNYPRAEFFCNGGKKRISMDHGLLRTQFDIQMTNLELHCAKLICKLRLALEKLKSLDNPTYLELGLHQLNWTFLQAADINLDSASKPDVPEHQKIFKSLKPEGSYFAAGVLGRKVFTSDQVLYTSNFKRISEINARHSDYVIIFSGSYRQFFEGLGFEDYSNAGAIICLHTPLKNAGTHANGALREAGIVLMAGKIDKKFLDSITLHQLSSRKLLVYANDAEEEGFVATVD